MRNLFLDTNILIDLLGDRHPFSKFAVAIFDRAEKKKARLFISSHSYATTHYLLKKYMDEKALRTLLVSLLDFIELIPVDLTIIKKSLLSRHKDFEGAIQIFAAHSVTNLDFIVTRNLKDFREAGITVLPPDEVIQYL